ncbi:MAG: 4'-phosphopantetheinyl transferase superfamily protein [Bacilli bacterium]|nr:4'-phosphopantetheinyl transferase superfamily protein [Bacilli bacterium]
MYFIYDNINNYTNNEFKTMFKSLNTNDKNKINKLINNQNKKLSILSKYLLKNILSQKYDLDYNNIYYNEFNKPLIDGIYFNISHSNNYVAICFSDKRIGIDIEKIREVNLNIINSFCTEKEKKYILNSENKYKSMFEIFCLKEAYFKMLGTNLFNIKKIEFNINSNSIFSSSNKNINIKVNYDIPNYIITIIEETGEI